MSDFKYILPPNEPKIIKDIGDVGIVPTITENISRSLRFNGSNAYLSRTPASASNRKTWTWSGWVKISSLSVDRMIATNTDTSGYNGMYFGFRVENTLEIGDYGVGSWDWVLTTSALFRDTSAWYHIVVAADTTQATASNRIKIYINGSQLTSFSTATYPSQNADLRVNSTSPFSIGRVNSSSYFFNGYMADVHFIDGQALLPTDFATTDNRTNSWVAKKYRGSYGNNGFNLKFEDNSGVTAATLGKDSSGNGNNWTPNNFAVSPLSDAGNDSLVDSPTNYGTDTGVGGTVRGNYCTLNPLSQIGGSFFQGNLRYTGPTDWRRANSTISVSTGKWYYEVTLGNAPFLPRNSGSAYNAFGFGVATSFNSSTGPGSITDGVILSDSGYYKNFSGSNTDGGTAFSSGDVLSIAVDLDANTYTFRRNNTQIATGTIGGTAGRELTPIIISYDGNYGVMNCNFGQRPFFYTAPTGFKTLCTTNLPIPRIKKPSLYFDAVTYTGTGATQSITGLGFSPDLLWTKGRSLAQNNNLFDTLRRSKRLRSDTTGAEALTTVMLDSNGFTLGTETESNNSGSTFVAWAWDAGSSSVTNNSGSITSTVRAEPQSGFSVCTFNVGASGAKTFGHGLSTAPRMVIVKSRTSALGWTTYHASVITATNQYIQLNTTSAILSVAGIWGSALPTSSVVGIGSGTNVNANDDCVAYCFAEVEGFSRFGSYTGNGSADGPFVYCGFRPRWVMIKMSSGIGDWYLFDTARDTFNATQLGLIPNSSGSETTYTGWGDITSNGFKIRRTDAAWNTNAGTYIFAAFAEMPFRYANAR